MLEALGQGSLTSPQAGLIGLLLAVLGLLSLLLWRQRGVTRGLRAELQTRQADQARQRADADSIRDSERRLAAVIEGTHIGTWEWHVQTGETVFNERWAQIVGYTLAELEPTTIQTWLGLAHPDDLERSNAALQRHFAGETDYYDIQCRMQHKQGHWVWVHDRGRVISWTASGAPRWMYGTHADITEQKQAELALQRNETLLRGLFELSPVGIALNDFATGDFVEVNAALLAPTGYSHDEFLALSYWDVTPREYEPQEIEQLRALEATGRYGPFEKEYIRKDGGRYPVQLNGMLVQDPSGQRMIWSIIEDMTARKAAEYEIKEKTRRQQEIIDALFGFIGIVSVDGILVEANDAPLRAAGLTRADVIGRHFADTYWWSYASTAQAELRQAMATAAAGQTIRYDTRLRVKDDHLIDIDAMFGPLRNAAGEVTQIIGFGVDITARKRAETALRDQAEHTQAILDNMLDAIITSDENGTIDAVNPATLRIFGYTDAAELRGQNVSILMPASHQQAHDRYMQDYRATGVARIIGIGRELEGRRKDGSLFPIELSIFEITRQGQPMYVGMIRDITERKQVERIQSEFVSTVSHELRTPLTAISGALGLVTGGAIGELPAQAKQMLTIAHNNSQRLAHLINDLLDIEKLAAGRLHFDMQQQALMPLLEQTLEANRAYGSEHQVTLQLTHSVPGAEIKVDSQRFMQVLTNLLSNAVKFSPEGGTVEVAAEQRGPSVWVRVTDHGPGIPAEFRGRIFQRFAQADASDTRQKGGTGLGLAITKELIERMGGRIDFESVEGEGTTFYIELPLWQAQAGATPAADQPALPADAPRVLVVEDEPEIANLLALMLSRAGYAVDIAGTASAALTALQSAPYDLMTLDLMLPETSGLEVIRQVRQGPANTDLPIVVVSAKVEEGRLAINGDFCNIDWLAKPIDEQRLLGTVQACLETTGVQRPRVLHVEDDADLHQVVNAMSAAHFDIEQASTLAQARTRVMAAEFDVVILDLSLPDGSGWELLPEIRQQQPQARVVILSGQAMSAADRRQVEAVLLKSQISPRQLLDALDRRLHHPAPATGGTVSS